MCSQPSHTVQEYNALVNFVGWPIAPSYMSPNAGGGVSANEYSCHRSPNKLWRSISIFNLCFLQTRKVEDPRFNTNRMGLSLYVYIWCIRASSRRMRMGHQRREWRRYSAKWTKTRWPSQVFLDQTRTTFKDVLHTIFSSCFHFPSNRPPFFLFLCCWQSEKLWYISS